MLHILFFCSNIQKNNDLEMNLSLNDFIKSEICKKMNIFKYIEHTDDLVSKLQECILALLEKK